VWGNVHVQHQVVLESNKILVFRAQGNKIVF
jgi:hypothetical protein